MGSRKSLERLRPQWLLPTLGTTLALVAGRGPAGGEVAAADRLPQVRVSAAPQGFVVGDGNRPFRPWGFNYDHDRAGRLLEDYWLDEWPTVVDDLAEMRLLGANCVRIHLQFGRFFPQPDRPDPRQLAQLIRLVEAAEEAALYVNLTGLGCYHRADTPAWYDTLDEAERWSAQARFWEELARACRGRRAVWCFDLMNEPVVAGAPRASGDWLGPPFAEKHFVQFVSLDPAGRPRPEIARSWTRRLATTIRQIDAERLVTVGLVDWSLPRAGLTSGFEPAVIAPEVDFLAVHVYPESGRIDAALATLRGFAQGKPLVVEETFPLRAGGAEFARFVDLADPLVSGWLGFYWGQTPEECRRAGTLPAALTAEWLELFARRAAATEPPTATGASRSSTE